MAVGSREMKKLRLEWSKKRNNAFVVKFFVYYRKRERERERETKSEVQHWSTRERVIQMWYNFNMKIEMWRQFWRRRKTEWDVIKNGVTTDDTDKRCRQLAPLTATLTSTTSSTDCDVDVDIDSVANCDVLSGRKVKRVIEQQSWDKNCKLF